MRIIAGDVKRRSIKGISAAHGVRPILARIRKSLFDILRPRLEGSEFLDLYAGSGAVGIEALSRGAAFVTFMDRNPFCLNVIRQNIATLQLQKRARVVKGNAMHPQLGFGAFDLIFMGPPYHDEKWNPLYWTVPTLQNIATSHWLKPGGLVVGQHHAKETALETAGWTLTRQEHYGDSRLSFFEQQLS